MIVFATVLESSEVTVLPHCFSRLLLVIAVDSLQPFPPLLAKRLIIQDYIDAGFDN